MFYLYNPMTKLRLTTLTFCLICAALSSVAQNQRLAATDYSQGIVFLLENDQMIWKHPAPDSNDLWVLLNGNVLFTTGNGVLEVNPSTGDTLFCYQSESSIFACQRLEDGNTFVGECSAGRLIEVSPCGQIVKEVSILPNDRSANMAFMRNARKTPSGTYLVAHYGDECVREYDEQGKVLWEVAVAGGPHSVVRLPNGNTLVAVADKTNNPRVVELNPLGDVVWQISNEDLPNAPLRFVGGMHYLPDGSLIFANWTGHTQDEKRMHIMHVNRKKEVLYRLDNRPDIQTVSSVFVPENIANGYH